MFSQLKKRTSSLRVITFADVQFFDQNKIITSADQWRTHFAKRDDNGGCRVEKNTHLAHFLSKRECGECSHYGQCRNIFAAYMSKSRSLAKISERRLQPLLV